MAIGSGLGSSLGMSAVTSTYGAYVAPTRFFRARSYNITRVPNRVQGEGIRQDGLLPVGAHYVETTEAATASIELDVQTKGFGLLLQAITGGTSTITGTTGAYLQTHTLGDPYGKNHFWQVGAPYRSGTVVGQSLRGGKVASAEFTCDATGILGVTVDIDGQQFSATDTYATPSYDATDVFHGRQAVIKVGTLDSEVEVAGVRSGSVSFTRAHDADDYTMNATGLKSEPVLNGLYDVNGSFEVDWLDKATFQDLVVSGDAKSIIWEFVGATLTGTTKSTFRIKVPNATFEGDMQGVGGVDVLTNSWTFNSRQGSGTELPTIEYISSDSAL